MGWIGCHTAAESLKAAFEDRSDRMAWGLGLSKSHNPQLTEDIRFFIADYRIKGRMLTLLIQNTKYPDHREVACFLIELNREYGEFLYKDIPLYDGFLESFPMLKTWAKHILLELDSRNITDEAVREHFCESGKYLAEAFQRSQERLKDRNR